MTLGVGECHPVMTQLHFDSTSGHFGFGFITLVSAGTEVIPSRAAFDHLKTNREFFPRLFRAIILSFHPGERRMNAFASNGPGSQGQRQFQGALGRLSPSPAARRLHSHPLSSRALLIASSMP